MKIIVDSSILEQALETLEQSETTVRYEGFGLAHREAERKHQEVIAALRAALEQAEPVEPVAKVELMTTGGNAGLATRIVEIDDHLRERLRPGQLLYTAPPQRKD